MKESNTVTQTNQRAAHSNLPGESFEAMIGEVEDYAIILLDFKGIVTTWNKGAEKIKGYRSDEIIGKSFRVFYPVEDQRLQLPDSLLNEAALTGRASHEGWRIRKDGIRFWGSITITALHGPTGEITGFLKLTRDLTDKKKLEDRHANMLEELRAKNEELRKEEQRYHRMVSEVQDYAIILLDPDGRIRDWNKGAERVKGYSSNEIIGKSFRLFYTHEDKEADLPQRLLEHALANGSVNHEGYRVRKDGSRFWANVTITCIHDDDGKLLGFSKVTKDLTDRKASEDRLAISTQELKRANEELRQSEERYHQMISEVQDYAILLLDETGAIQNWNAGAELIKGYAASEVIGKSFHLFYCPEDVSKGIPDSLLQEARVQGRSTAEGWRRKKNGSKFWASVVITALHDRQGKVVGFSKVTRDLSDRKVMEDRLRATATTLEQKNRELENLNSELSSFAYIVSHDFKEPIRKIQVFGYRQLEENKSLDELREFSRKIISSAERMQTLMESLLLYSRISNYNAVPEEVNLMNVLTDVEADLEVPISENHATIKSHQLPTIMGVRYELHQLFLNLISNSIKFKHSERHPVINISCTSANKSDLPEGLHVHDNEYYCITFQDNGMGFEPSQANKIFEVFRRLNPTSNVHGTGIGLSIVKKVVLNHHGAVSAEGVEGEGAIFRVYLPC